MCSLMERLWVNPALRQEIGSRGYQAYQERWTEEVHLNTISRCLRRQRFVSSEPCRGMNRWLTLAVSRFDTGLSVPDLNFCVVWSELRLRTQLTIP